MTVLRSLVAFRPPMKASPKGLNFHVVRKVSTPYRRQSLNVDIKTEKQPGYDYTCIIGFFQFYD